jgi:hypothetical protein
VAPQSTRPPFIKVLKARQTSGVTVTVGSGPVTPLACAGRSMDLMDAPKVHANTLTNVASAAPQTMGPRSAPADSLLPIVTSFRPDVWEEELQRAGAPQHLREVPKGLRDGFTVGLENFTLRSSFIPKNHSSASEHESFLLQKYDSEISAGRVSRGYSLAALEELMGPIRTAPIGVVASADKLRVIIDHSFPDKNAGVDLDSLPRSPDGKLILDASTTSVNSVTDLTEFTCDWGTFSDCWLLVAEAPEGTQAAVFDVESAFRNLPLHPSVRRFLAIRLLDKIHIDHCLNFGHSPSPAVWGRVADAMAWILKHHGVEALLKWVDDFVFFRYPVAGSSSPNWVYSYDESLLHSVANRLSWPWSPSKCFPFSFSFKYIGFLWDLQARTVEVPEKKKAKYLTRLQSWVAESKHSLSEVESLIGTLNHVCLVVPLGRSYLAPLYRFRASFSSAPSSFSLRTPSAQVISAIEWWRSSLASPFLGMRISRPPPPSSHSLFVDASTSWGIGLFLNGRWLAWQFKPGCFSDGREIGWGEMAAVNLAVATLVSSGIKNTSLVGFTDNQGVWGALRAGYSRGPRQNEVLRKIVQLLQENNIWLKMEWVRSEDNPADGPSRGIFPPKKLIHGHPPSVPAHLRPFVNQHVSHQDPRLRS